MNPYSIPPLISTILFFSLGLFCYLRNKESKINMSFALMCLTTVWWQGSWTILFNTQNSTLAAILVKVGYSGITFIPITFYHFTIEFLNRQKEKKLIWLSYAIGIGFLICLWTTDWYIKGYYTFYWGFYPKASLILHPLYLTMLSAQTMRILYLLFMCLKKKQLEPIKRNQIKYMFWAIFFYSFATVDFADNYGLEVYPLGFIAILIFMAIIGYSIAKYRLLDIHFIIRKSITNLILIGLTSCIICTAIYLKVSLATVFLGIIMACLLVAYIPKLKIKIEDTVIRILYKKKYDYLDRLEEFIERMVLIPKEEELLKETVGVLERDLDVESVAILVRDPITNDYMVKHKVDLDGVGEFSLSEDSKIAVWLKENKGACVLEEMEKIMHTGRLRVIEKELEPLRAKVCVPMRTDGDLAGIITLGNKSTGEMYSHIDLELLERLGVQLAVALDYRHIEAELRKEQELTAIGTLAMEIGHEMRNLLTAPYTFIEMLDSRKDDPDFMKDFKDMAFDRLRVTRGKLEDIMYFGKEHTITLIPGIDIQKLIDDTLLANNYSIKKNRIEVVKEYGDIPTIKGDHDHLVHLFSNLVLNAIDAMEPEDRKGGKLQIRTELNEHLTGEMKKKSEQWIRIEVKDDGEGIPEHIKKKLFTPFVTTKSGGGIQRKGTGLGLSVVKKAIDAHQGYIYVHSKEGKGTTMIVDLPVSLKAAKVIMPATTVKGESGRQPPLSRDGINERG